MNKTIIVPIILICFFIFYSCNHRNNNDSINIKPTDKEFDSVKLDDDTSKLQFAKILISNLIRKDSFCGDGRKITFFVDSVGNKQGELITFTQTGYISNQSLFYNNNCIISSIWLSNPPNIRAYIYDSITKGQKAYTFDSIGFMDTFTLIKNIYFKD